MLGRWGLLSVCLKYFIISCIFFKTSPRYFPKGTLPSMILLTIRFFLTCPNALQNIIRPWLDIKWVMRVKTLYLLIGRSAHFPKYWVHLLWKRDPVPFIHHSALSMHLMHLQARYRHTYRWFLVFFRKESTTRIVMRSAFLFQQCLKHGESRFLPLVGLLMAVSIFTVPTKATEKKLANCFPLEQGLDYSDHLAHWKQLKIMDNF